MKINRYKKSMILSIIALVCSLLTLAVYVFKIDKNDIGNADTFIAVSAAFIGISVALVIGFQIYSVLSINDKVSMIDKFKQDLEKNKKIISNTQERILELEDELKGNISEAKAWSLENQNKHAEAYNELTYALLRYCNLESYKESLHTYVDALDLFSKQISIDEFNEKISRVQIASIVLMIENSTIKIKNTKFYWVIKDKYITIYETTRNKLKSLGSI